MIRMQTGEDSKMHRDGDGVAGEHDRAALIARWLRDIGGYTASDATIQMLRRCANKATLEFVASFLVSPGWFILDDAHFANQQWQLSIRPSGIEPVVDVLVENRRQADRVALEVVADTTMPNQQHRQEAKAEALQQQGIEFRAVRARDIPHVAKHVNDKLAAISRQHARFSTVHYAELVGPALVWKPLGDEFDLTSLGPVKRQQELANWVAERGIDLAGEYLQILAMCDWHGTVNFCLPILRAGKWKVHNNRVVAGGIGLEVKPARGSQVFDFIIGRLDSTTMPPTVIEVVKPHSYKRPREEQFRQNRRVAAQMAGLRFLEIDAGEAGHQGRLWAEDLVGTPSPAGR